MAEQTLSFSTVSDAHVATLTVTKPVKIHIENGGGRTSFYSKLSSGTRYQEIKNSAQLEDTVCVTITDEVYPFNLKIVSETPVSLAKYEFAE